MIFENIINRFIKHKSSIKNAGLYFSANLIGMGITIAINPFMALNLSHEDYALLGYFASFNSLLLPIISFSFISYYSRHFFILEERKRERLRNTLLISLVWFSLAVSVLSLLALYIYFKINHVVFPFFPYALLNISSLFFANFNSFKLIDLRLNRNAKEFFKLYLSRSVLAALLAILLVVVVKGGALGKMVAISLSVFIFAIYDFRKLLTKWEFDQKIFMEAFRFCWPLSLAAMLTYFLSGVDRAMLEQMGDIRQLGLYNVAIQITGYLTVFNTSIGDTFQPDILQSIAEKKKRKTIKLIGVISLMNTIPILVFIVFAPFLIKFLTYNRFTDAADFARILSIKNITESLYYSMSTVIIGYGFSEITLINKVIGTILSFLMFKTLIAHLGFYGAAWGQVFSFLIVSVLSVVFLFYKLKTKKNYVQL